MKNIYEKTLRLVRETDIPTSKLASDTGLGLRWMHKLIAGEFTDPGVKKIERLYNYLSAEAAPRTKKRRAA